MEIAITFDAFARTLHNSSKLAKLEKDWCVNNNARIESITTNNTFTSINGLFTCFKEHLNKSNKDSYILIYQIDNATKSDVNTISEFFKELIESSYKIVLLKQNVLLDKTSISDGSYLWNTFEMIKAYEQEQSKSESRKNNWDLIKKDIDKGKKPSFRKPSWLDYDQEKEEYKPNELADSVRACFDIYLECMSMIQTARQLNEQGYKTLRNKVGAWQYSSVRSILTQKSTYGQLDSKNLQKENFFPEVIPKSKFELTQRSIKSVTHGNSKRNRQSSVSNLLTRIATCGVCGDRLYLHGKKMAVASGHVEDYRYLSCNQRKFDKDSCTLPNFRYKYIEPAIVLVVQTVCKVERTEKAEKYYNDLIERLGHLKADRDNCKNNITSARYLSTLLDIENENDAHILEQHVDNLKRIEREILTIENTIAIVNELRNKSGVYDEFKKASKYLDEDENYRARFIMHLSYLFQKCQFNDDGSLYIESIGNEVNIKKLEGNVSVIINDVQIASYSAK